MKTKKFIEIREKMGWSRKTLAKHLGIHPITVSRIEKEETTIKKLIEREMDRLDVKAEGLCL